MYCRKYRVRPTSEDRGKNIQGIDSQEIRRVREYLEREKPHRKFYEHPPMYSLDQGIVIVPAPHTLELWVKSPKGLKDLTTLLNLPPFA